MDHPTISIVISTYGRAEYLKVLIESLRSSVPEDKREIIIVSSDDPAGEKAQWLRRQPDIKLILADNRGHGRRKRSLYYYNNLGTKLAKNEWVFVLNDDMKASSGWYEVFCSKLAEPGMGKVGMVIVATHIGSFESGYRVAKLGWTQKPGQPKKDLYLSDFSIIKKEAFEAIGYFDESINWYGSGMDNSLAMALLTDFEVAVVEEIKSSKELPTLVCRPSLATKWSIFISSTTATSKSVNKAMAKELSMPLPYQFILSSK